eukprot:9894832-Alexandrium_andersonii.AAC.1
MGSAVWSAGGAGQWMARVLPGPAGCLRDVGAGRLDLRALVGVVQPPGRRVATVAVGDVPGDRVVSA